MKYVILLLIPFIALAQFTSGTTKQIDQINNNTATDITINPVNSVLIPYLTNGELLYYNSGISSLGNGSENQVLSITGGVLAWIDPPPTSPTTTEGDMIYNDGGGNASDIRLAIGTVDQLLSSNGTIPVWIDPPISSPITTEGDISIGNASGDPIRLPIGLSDQLLTSNGTTASWQDAPVSLPDQTGNEGNFLVTDGTDASWSDSITGLISQAQFVGSLTYQEAGCDWKSTSSTETSMPVEPLCVASNIVGDVEAPDTKLPAIKIPNARTDGYYQVKTQGLVYQQTDAICVYSLSSTGSYENQGRTYVDANEKAQNSLMGNFKFSTGGDKQVEVIVDRLSGTGNCIFYGGDTLDSKFTVHFFPDSNSLAAITETQLTAQTANEFSFTVSGAGVVTQDEFDIINGNCTVTSGIPSCVFNGGIFSQTPNVIVGVCRINDDTASADKNVTIANQTSSGFNIVSRLTATQTTSQTAVCVKVSKTGADVNKSQIIAGTFEQIAESDINLTAATANELSANIRGTGVTVDSENYDWINGNCVDTSAGVSTCTFNAGIFTETPSCEVTVVNSSNSQRVAKISTLSALAIAVKTYDAAGALTDFNYNLQCSKQGADVTTNYKAIVVNAGAGGISPMSNKGELYGYDGANNVAIPAASSDGQFVISDSSTTSGVKFSDTLSGSLNPVSDFQTYTPTVAGLGSGVITSNEAQYRRVGDSIEIIGRMQMSATAGTGGANVTFTLPSGLVIDNTKITNASSEIGHVSSFDVDTASGSITSSVYMESANTDKFWFIKNNTGSVLSGSDFRASSYITYSLKLPISGWSSGIDAVSQFKTLDATSANIITTTLNATTGDEVRNDFDLFNGACTYPSTNSIAECNFNSGLFTETPSCKLQVEVGVASSVNQYTLSLVKITKDELDIRCNSNDLAVNCAGLAMTVSCSKQGSDYNKEIVIAAPIDSQKWECEKKFLTGNSTSAGYLTDLDFTSVIGKKYSAIAQINGATGAETHLRNDATTIARYFSGNNVGIMQDSCFEATGAQIRFYHFNATTVNGGGGATDTWMQVCKLPDNYICN